MAESNKLKIHESVKGKHYLISWDDPATGTQKTRAIGYVTIGKEAALIKIKQIREEILPDYLRDRIAAKRARPIVPVDMPEKSFIRVRKIVDGKAYEKKWTYGETTRTKEAAITLAQAYIDALKQTT